MVNTEIYINGNAIDLYKDENISLIYSISDVRGINRRSSTYSKSITVPGTTTNNQVFNHIYDLGSDSSFNPGIKSKCYIMVDSIMILEGYAQLVEINRDLKNEVVDYKITIYASTKDLFDSLSNNNNYLTDLNYYTGTTVSKLSADIESSWDKNINNLYCFALVDKGYGWSFPQIANGSRPIYTEELQPSLYLKPIVDSIFSGAGYSYTSNFLNGDYFKSLLVNSNTEDVLTANYFYKQNVFFDFLPYGLSTNRPVTYHVEVAKIDVFGNAIVVNSVTNTQANSPVSTYGFTHTLSGSTNLKVGERLYTRISVEPVFLDWLFYSSAHTTFNVWYDDPMVSKSFSAETTGLQRIEYHVGTPDVWRILYNTEWDPYNIFDLSTSIHTAPDLNLKYYLPKKVKQLDLIKWVINAFDLFIDEDKNNSNNLIIEPRINYYTDTITYDLKDVIDLSKDTSIKLLSEVQNKELLWHYTSDEDYLNNDYQTAYKDEYGTYRTNLQNDFTTGTQEVKLGFSPTPIQEINGSHEIIIPRIYNLSTVNKEENTDYNIRLWYYPGLLDLATEKFLINYGTNGNKVYYQLPYAGEVDSPYNPSFSLNFATPNKVYWNGGQNYPANNLYTTFWKGYVNAINDKNSKLFTCYVNVGPSFINKITFRDLYYIEGQYFRLNKIEYNALGNSLTKIELLKFDYLNTTLTTRDTIYHVGPQARLGISNGKFNNLSNSSVVNGYANDINYASSNILSSGNQNRVIDSGNIFLFGNNNLVSSSANTVFSFGDSNSGFTDNVAFVNASGNTVLSGTNITIIGLNDFTGATSSNTVYMPYVSVMSGITVGGVLLNQYWTAGTGTQSLIRYPVQNGILGAGQLSIITGGKFNTATTASLYGFVGNGKYNKTAYNFASVLNGKNNTANGYHSSIISGSFNYVQSAGSVIIGGQNNYARGQKNIIGNGTRNLTDDGFSFIGNGKYNSGYTDYSFIGNGFQNKTFGSFSTIINGTSNSNNGPSSIILNGLSNLINIQSVNGSNNLIGVGTSNVIKNGQYNIIQNGKSNYIDLLSSTYNSYNSIFNGRGNKIKDTTGYQTNFNSILAGKYNFIYHTSPSTSYANSNSILAGDYHTITNSTNCSILNGTGLSILNDTNLSLGEKLRLRSLTSTTYNYVVADASGQLHITGVTPSVSGSGSTPNYWEKQGGVGSIALTGYSASINALSDYSIIAGYNTEISNGDYNGAFAGASNHIDGNYCLIAGGQSNLIIGSNSYNSIINSYSSTINGKDSYELILNSNNCKITGDSGNAAIINSKDSTLNLAGSASYFATLIGLSAYTHNNTVSTDHIVVVPKLKHLGSVYSKNSTVAANYTVTEWDYLITVKTDAAYTITLPSSPKDGMQLYIKDYYGSASINNINVDGGSINIDAATTFVMDKDYASLQLLYTSNNNQWVVLNYYF